MTISPRDAERARQFLANRNQTRQINRGSTALELAQVQTALDHYKNKLASAMAANDSTAIDQALNQLITLRSTQCVLRLKQKQEIGQLTPEIIKNERDHYYTDCYQLISTAA